MSWSSSALREPNKRHENVGDKLKRTQKLCWQSLKKYFIRFKSGLWRRSRCGTLLENICDGLKGHKMVLLGFLVEINGTRLLFIQDDSQESRKMEKYIPYYQFDILFQLKEVLLKKPWLIKYTSSHHRDSLLLTKPLKDIWKIAIKKK